MFGWLRQLFAPKQPPELQGLALAETALVEEKVWPLFQRNLQGAMRGNFLAMLENPRSEEVRDLFLWGMIASVLAGRSSLPTDAHDRIALHLLRFFAQEGKFEDARARMTRARDTFNELNPYFEQIVEDGAQAMAENDPHALYRCYLD